MFNHTIPVNNKLEYDGPLINNITNLKYLGACMTSSQHDFEIRKALSWSVIHKMKSGIPKWKTVYK